MPSFEGEMVVAFKGVRRNDREAALCVGETEMGLELAAGGFAHDRTFGLSWYSAA